MSKRRTDRWQWQEDQNSPHLASEKGKVPDDRVGKTVEGNSMRSTRVVGAVLLLLDPFVPDVPVAVQGASAVPVDDNVVSTEDESSRLVLVADIQRVLEPIINVLAELDTQHLSSL